MSLHSLILAAGRGSRFNQDIIDKSFTMADKNLKQLAMINGQTMLARSVDLAKAITPGGVTVVLGYGYPLLQPLVHDVHVVIHSNWKKGIGNSIAYGVDALPSHVSAVLIFLCDQVALGLSDLKNLKMSFEDALQNGRSEIVCAAYEGGLGVPAIFPREYFPALTALEGDTGAKKILYANSVISMPLAAAAIDIDTKKQWFEFTANQSD